MSGSPNTGSLSNYYFPNRSRRRYFGHDHGTTIIPLTAILPLITAAIPQTLTGLLDDGRSPPQHHHQRPPHPNHSTHHEHLNHHEPERPSRTANAVSKRQRYLENNRRAAHRDPFGHLKSLPEPSLNYTDQSVRYNGKLFALAPLFNAPNTMFPSVIVCRLGFITSVGRIN